MMQKNYSEVEVKKLDKKEKARIIAKNIVTGIASNVPFLGAIVNPIEGSSNEIWIKTQFLELGVMLNLLNKKVEDIENLIKSPEFMVELNNLAVAHFQEANKQKRSYLRNMFINHVKNYTDNFNKLAFNIKQVNKDEVTILGLFDGVIEKFVNNPSASSGIFNAEVTRRCLKEKLNIDFAENYISDCCNNLVSLGLLRKPPARTHVGDHFFITSLGKELIGYIKEP
ncbi:MAG: hypothetical protein C4562_05410 [Actinobacteria bacterium]|nr:MAG: hypothetical protein C4562_05410 [Actinomycetota bacterium]